MKYTIEEIKGLLEGITPGEWVVDGDLGYRPVICNTAWKNGGNNARCICDMRGPRKPYPPNEEQANNAVFIAAASTIIRDLLAENERLSSLAAQHLADQELLVARERKRVARECIDYVNNHASDCGCSQKIAHDIRTRYGIN